MPNLDELNIKISAEAQSASTSLNNLISTLGNVASKISAVSKTPLKVNFTVTGGAEKEVNRLEQYVNKSAKTMSKNLQNAFNISPNNMAGVREAVNDLTKSVAATGDADMEKLVNEILNVGRAARETDETTKQFYSTFNSMSKIAINSADMTTDAWKDMNGAIRRVFTSDLSSGAMTLDQWIQSLNTDLRVFLQQFGDISASGNQFQTLSEAIKYCQEQLNMPLKNDSIDNQVLAMERLESETQKVVIDINNVKTALEATGATTETKNTGFSNITSVLTKLSKIDTGALTKVGTACESISAGVQSLNGVHVDVNSLEQIGNLTEKLKKIPTVNTDNIKNIGDALNTLSTSINSVSSIGSVDKSITNLVNALKRLAEVNMSNFNANSLNGIVEMVQKIGALPDVSNSINRLVSSLARLASSGASIQTVTAELPALGTALQGVVTSMSSLGAVDSSILSFSSAIAQLASSGSKIGTVVTNLRELGNALSDVMVQLSSAPAINSSVIQMTSALSNLAAQGSKVGSAANSMSSGLNNFANKANNAKSIAKSLTSTFAKLYSVVFLLRRVFSAVGDSIEYASDLTEVQNIVDVAFGDYKDAIEDFSETSIGEYGINELTAKTIASRYQAMSNAIGLTTEAAANANTALSEATNGYVEAGGSVADMSVNLTKLAADMASFYNVDADEVAEDLESVFTGTTKPLRQYGLDLTQATLQEWALKNGLDADISSMTQAEKVMLRYQYVLANTTDAQGDFSRTSDTWANRVRVLKLQIQQLATTIGGAFINALKPALRALNSFMTSVIEIVENIVNALGKIFGWTIETTNTGSLIDDDETTDATDAIADGYDDATAAAKEYENTVLSIDSLHKLNSTSDDSDSGSSGSGSGGSSSGSGITTTIKQTEGLIDYYKSEINSLYELGEYIGTTLTNALANIDWDSVYQSARNFGTGLADFLNGLISPELFYQVGRTIANALNTAIYASLSFATTFDWTDLGLSIAAGINGFFQNFDFTSLAASINAWVQGILTMIKTAIGNISWKDVWSGITDFLGELDISTVGIIIGAVVIKKILGMKLLSGAFSSITKSLQTQLANFLKNNALTIAGITLVISGVVISASSIKEMWNNGFSLGDEVQLGIGAGLAGVGAAILAAVLAPFTGGASLAVYAGIAAAVAGGIFGGGNLVLLIHNKWEDITEETKEVGRRIRGTWEGVKETTKENWENIKTNLGSKWEEIKKNAKTKFGNIKTNISTTWDNVKTNTSNKWKNIKSNLGTTWDSVKSNASTKFGNIKTNISTTWDNVKTNTTTKWGTIKSTLSTKWSDIKSNASTKFGNIKTSISTTWDNIKTNSKNKWDGIKTSLSSIWTTIKNGGINAFSTMGTKIKEGFDNLKTSLKKKAAKLGEAVISPIKKLVNGVIKGINWILDKLGSSTTVKEWAGVDFSNYYATGSSGIPQDTIGVVNDQKGSVYKELIVPPTGDAFIPEGRNVTLPLAKGTKILPAAQTAELLKSSMPHFKTGIGDLLGGAWSKIKEFTGNVWDYISKPKELVQLAIDKFTDISDMVSPWTDVAKGAINTTLDNIVDFVKGKFDTAVPSVTYDPSKGVSQWSDLAKYALKLCGQYTSANLSRLLYQMQTESGGNPNAINLWDSNAKKGTPSKGLMQVIDPTFKAYAMKGYNTNIYDPLSNMLAAIRYTVARYGSLTKGWQGHGYASGIGNINLSDLIPRFSLGGIVEDGLFQANHNEIIGKFGNGKTAVANNEQIADGIAAAVQPAVYNAMMAANAANKGKNIELVIELDGEEIGRTAVNYQKLQNKRYTVEPSFV